MRLSTVIRSLAMLVLVCAFAACGSPSKGGGGDLEPKDWEGHISRAEENGLVVYWLGESFEEGGVVFDHLEGGEVVDPRTALTLHYFSDVDEYIIGGLDLTSFTAEQWQVEKDRLTSAPDIVGETRRSVVIDGVEGELISTPMGSRPVNSLQLALEFDDAVVYAATNSAVTEAGVEVNPLIEESAFLSVLEGLRKHED